MTISPVHVIGAGLAGCEAVTQLTRHGIPVILHEMRPVKSDEAHKTAYFAELSAATPCAQAILKTLSAC